MTTEGELDEAAASLDLVLRTYVLHSFTPDSSRPGEYVALLEMGVAIALHAHGLMTWCLGDPDKGAFFVFCRLTEHGKLVRLHLMDLHCAAAAAAVGLR